MISSMKSQAENQQSLINVKNKGISPEIIVFYHSEGELCYIGLSS